jgi:hypothetical protein
MVMHPRERVDELVQEERLAGADIPPHVTQEEDAVTAGFVGGVSVLGIVAGAAVGAAIGIGLLVAFGQAWWAGLLIGGIAGAVLAAMVMARLSLDSVAPLAYERRNDERPDQPPPRAD